MDAHLAALCWRLRPWHGSSLLALVAPTHPSHGAGRPTARHHRLLGTHFVLCRLVGPQRHPKGSLMHPSTDATTDAPRVDRQALFLAWLSQESRACPNCRYFLSGL